MAEPGLCIGRFASALLVAGLMWSADATAAVGAQAVPDFSTNTVAWIGIGNDLDPPASGPGPVRSDKDHPYVSNAVARATGAQPNFRVADLSNPILQPWVVEALRK